AKRAPALAILVGSCLHLSLPSVYARCGETVLVHPAMSTTVTTIAAIAPVNEPLHIRVAQAIDYMAVFCLS
ncbi:MAG: hypothetical protein LUP95_06125, partial [Euryarchaeota archaeon]|nr:hypothetical protein [Euryarchaeota archaeon]